MTDEGRDARLLRYLEGEASPTERSAMEAALDRSPSERRLVAEFTRLYGDASESRMDHSAVESARTVFEPRGSEPDDAPLVPRLPPRYELREHLGAGGMGVVLGAHDRQLGRPVALKLLGAMGRDAEAKARLRREALALAQLSHPHVVRVYDVGEHEGRLYIAMEWVAGRTLAQWQAEAPRTVAEILAFYAQAGEGLAAAHAHGIVHRDFKPSNVLVGDDGRVRVVDFGLARLGPTRELDPITAPSLGSVSDPDAVATLTKTGLVMGTPAYMSPEQAEGREPGPASDQFSFCVALHEAFHGWRPVLMGVPHPPPPLERRGPGTSERVPPRLHAAIRRGLAPRPEDRWPSMHALLRELRAGERASRTRWAWGVGLGGAGVAALALAMAMGMGAGGAEDPCERGVARMAEVWGEGPRRALKEGSGDAAVREAIVAQLDARAGEWSEAYGAVCREASGAGEAGALFDLRMRCLEEQRRGMAAVVPLVLDDAPDALARGATLVEALPSARACLERASDDVMLPVEPARRDAAQRLREGLDGLEALRQAEGREPALRRAEELHAEAEALGHPPLSALAELRLGEALVAVGRFADARAPLERAFFAARAAGVHDVAMDAVRSLVPVVRRLTPSLQELDRWIDQLCVTGEMTGDRQAQARCEVDRGLTSLRRAQPEAALRHVEQALARLPAIPTRVGSEALVLRADALTALGRLPEAEAAFAEAIASERARAGEGSEGELSVRALLAAVHLRQGRDVEAHEELAAVLPLLERALGPDHPDVGRVVAHTALALEGLGRDDEALPYHERALALFERAMGPRSTDVAMLLGNLGQLHLRKGDAERALPYLERGLEVMSELYDEEHPMVAQYHSVLGSALALAGRDADAVSHMERALRDLEAALGAGHTRVAEVCSSLGPVYDAVGRVEEGEAILRRSLRIRREAGQAEHPDTALTQVGLGRLMVGHGRFEEAAVELRQALADMEAQLGAEHVQLRVALHQLARAEHGLGRHADAVAHAKRALALYEAGGFARYLPEVRVTLAQALWDGRIDRKRAVAEMEAARGEYAALGSAEGVAEVEAELRRFGKRRRGL